MRKIVLALVTLVIGSQLFAYSIFDTSAERMYREVGKELNHKIEKHEQNIVDTTYSYYFKQCDGKWNKETWNTAVQKSVELCNNKAAVTAAKAGEFGEKLLQAIIITGEDIWHGFNNWVNDKSDEYKKRK